MSGAEQVSDATAGEFWLVDQSENPPTEAPTSVNGDRDRTQLRSAPAVAEPVPDGEVPRRGRRGRRRVHSGTPMERVDPAVIRSCGVAFRRMEDSHLESIAVTSTSRLEGRTTIAMGFAAVASSQGRRTILVDLDVLHRDLHEEMGLPGGPGVAELLAGKAVLDECVQPVADGLWALTAGESWTDQELGRLDGLAELIRELQAKFDIVVADMPQLDAGVAAARMADLFDAVALVVRAGAVTVAKLKSAVSVLRQKPYVILNGVGQSGSALRRRLVPRKP